MKKNIFYYEVSSVIAFSSKEIDIFKILDAMNSKGWHLNALQNPNGQKIFQFLYIQIFSIHICVTLTHIGKEDLFLNDLKESVEIVKANPNAFPSLNKNFFVLFNFIIIIDGLAPIYGMAASIPDKSIIDETAAIYIDTLLNI